MENASKALIIAGSILVTILVISLGILIYNTMGGAARDQANMDEQEISAFNSKLTPYLGSNISGSQVNALIQEVIGIDYAAVNSGDKTRVVTITFPINNGTGTNTISVNNKGDDVTNLNNGRRVGTGAGISYNVEASYAKNGLISSIKVTKNSP